MRRPSLQLGRRRLLAIAGLLVLLAGIGVAVADPFAGSAAPSSSLDNGSPTSTRRVERASLSSQTQIGGTLGYAGSWTVSVPAGTAPSAVLQAEQQRVSAQAGVTTAQQTESADEQALAQARSALRAAQLEQASDCSGSGAAAGSTSPCATAMQNVTAGQTAESGAEQKASADEAQLATARATLSGAQQALSDAQASATSYAGSASFTALPSPGRVVQRGQSLYAIDGEPTVLLYGSTSAWRVFRAGMSPGRDVAELNANLRALGFGAPTGDAFTAATGAAISALQQARGLAATGSLALGAVVFEPGPFRVTTVTPTVGGAVQPGPVVTGTSTHQDVSIQLDAAQQSEVEAGDKVSVILPDNSSTPGVVSAVGKVATTPSASDQAEAGGASSSPTIDVDVRLLHARAAGHLDEAPVEVSITEQSVRNVLAVPVNALVALAGGGYAVEEVEASGLHQLVAVTPGLFDDARGLVQVSGSGLAVGERVVVPAE